MQIRQDNQNGKNSSTRAKTTLVLSCLLTVLCVGLIIVPVHEALAFTFRITILAVDATSDMGKMKVKVTVKEKEHSFSTDKGVTKSKIVNIGKQALYWDDSDFIVAQFQFKGVEKGDSYIACIAKACHDSETITKKKVTEKIRVRAGGE